MVCRLDMLPPPGEALRAVVERERRVAGDVFFKKGHMDFDWRSTASMIAFSRLVWRSSLLIQSISHMFGFQISANWERCKAWG
jgi:hypothetical protein